MGGNAHYFDDVLHRHIATQKEKPKRIHMRRSSTARSIGARSDFDTIINGEGLDARSVVADDPEREAERREANTKFHQHLSGQLQELVDGNEEEINRDEYEAHV